MNLPSRKVPPLPGPLLHKRMEEREREAAGRAILLIEILMD
jgi:hypothetical protein